MQVFYGDIYFILNFIMNLFILLILTMIGQKTCTGRRIVFMSALFALISVVTGYLCFNIKWMGNILGIMEMIGMLWMTFRPRYGRELLKDFWLLIFVSFVVAGAINCVEEMFIKSCEGKISLWTVIISGALITISFVLLRHFWIQQCNNMKNEFTVKIVHNQREIRAVGLVDTGNQLVSPYTGEQVIVISEQLSNQLELHQDGRLLIPYRSIGGNGMLNGYRLQELWINNKKYCHVLGAVSPRLGRMENADVILPSGFVGNCKKKS